jgi:hypothetical protein
MSATQTGYGPQVGTSPQGYPIYLYTDEQAKVCYHVVVLPDGRAFPSDDFGNIVAAPVEANKQVGLALAGVAVGFLAGGPAGAIIGAIVGAVAGAIGSKHNQTLKR